MFVSGENLFFTIFFKVEFFIFWEISLTGIDGQEDMKLICGTTVVEEKDKLEKEDKVIN